MIDRVFHGRPLTESLREGVDLAVPGMRVARLGRHDVSDSTTARTAGTRTSSPTTNTWSPFAGRVFRYRKGDPARADAVAHGRAVGTPEHQLDWGD